MYFTVHKYSMECLVVNRKKCRHHIDGNDSKCSDLTLWAVFSLAFLLEFHLDQNRTEIKEISIGR